MLVGAGGERSLGNANDHHRSWYPGSQWYSPRFPIMTARQNLVVLGSCVMLVFKPIWNLFWPHVERFARSTMSGRWILLSLFISYNFQRNAKLEERASKIEVYHVRTSFLNLPLFFGVCESSFIGLLASCGTYFGTSIRPVFPFWHILKLFVE